MIDEHQELIYIIKKMAKSSIVAAFATALCFSFFLNSAYAKFLTIEGKVYCDTCRVEFQTKISDPLPGATVRLECRHLENNSLTYSQEAVCDKSGNYRIDVEGEHEEEICEVKVVRSPRADCNEIFGSADSARVLLSSNVGVVQPVRFANPLGFKAKVALKECAKVLQEYGFLPILH